MSNKAFLVKTKFEDVESKESSYGIRLFDSYEQFYAVNNDLSNLKGLDLLKKVVESINSTDSFLNGATDLLSNLVEMQRGIEIDGEWFDFEEIEEILEGK
jgi:hypothetical protein